MQRFLLPHQNFPESIWCMLLRSIYFHKIGHKKHARKMYANIIESDLEKYQTFI